MLLPPYGLCLPCKCVRVIDADTVVVTILGTLEWHIRLIGCWAPEKSHPIGVNGKAFAESLIDNADAISVWIPSPEKIVKNILSLTSMERVPGHIFLGTEHSLNEIIIRAGYAWPTKAEQLRAVANYDETHA